MQVVPHGSHTRWEVVMVWLKIVIWNLNNVKYEDAVESHLEITIGGPVEVEPAVIDDDCIVANILQDMITSVAVITHLLQFVYVSIQFND